MNEQLTQYIKREISDLDDNSSREYLRKLMAPRLIKYYETEKGYALHECWVVARVKQSEFYLCVVEGELAGVRSWGLLKRYKNKYVFASHEVSTLSSILDDVEYILQSRMAD